MAHDLTFLTIKSLLTKNKESDAFLKFFPKEDEGALKKTPGFTEIPRSVFSPLDILSGIHESHLAPLLAKYPEEVQKLIRSSLPENGAKELIPLPPFAKNYFIQLFYSQNFKETVYPKEFLPKNALNELLLLTKAQLVLLIDLLGIEDLAIDLKKVMDRQVLEGIRKELSAYQRQYLSLLLQKTTLVLIQPERISFWQHETRKQVQRKGMVRLAAALQGCDAKFLWYILQLLDVKRAGELQEALFAKEKLPAKHREVLASQMALLIKALRGKK